ncbi:hypothetical protein [Myxococcus xanthus]|uniref:hypothetical protein n=1 Tax=Myxococcus xanthus TaxID=34 RepID=UPI0020A472F0|nr:hypothetical protein [Myxococcus xanthus]
MDRRIDTIKAAAEEALLGGGEVLNREVSKRAAGYPFILKPSDRTACSSAWTSLTAELEVGGGVVGIGREGVKYAIEDMTELRLLVLRQA